MMKTENNVQVTPLSQKLPAGQPEAKQDHVDKFKKLLKEKKTQKNPNDSIKNSKATPSKNANVKEKNSHENEQQDKDQETSNDAFPNDKTSSYSSLQEAFTKIEASQKIASAEQTEAKNSSFINHVAARIEASGETLEKGGILTIHAAQSILPDTIITAKLVEGQLQIGFSTQSLESEKWLKNHKDRMMRHITKKTGHNIDLQISRADTPQNNEQAEG